MNFPRNLIAAEQGNAEAQCAVGYAYLTGEGVKRDLVKAMHGFDNANLITRESRILTTAIILPRLPF